MAFATEGYQQLVSAGVALDPQESMLEQAALQVGFELGFDEARQMPSASRRSRKRLLAIPYSIANAHTAVPGYSVVVRRLRAAAMRASGTKETRTAQDRGSQ